MAEWIDFKMSFFIEEVSWREKSIYAINFEKSNSTRENPGSNSLRACVVCSAYLLRIMIAETSIAIYRHVRYRVLPRFKV